MGLPLNAPKSVSVDLTDNSSQYNPDNIVTDLPDDNEHNATITSPNTQVPSDKNVKPQKKKSGLNPNAKVFNPNRLIRNKRQPKWLASSEWTR